MIAERQKAEGWGKSVVQQLAADLQLIILIFLLIIIIQDLINARPRFPGKRVG